MPIVETRVPVDQDTRLWLDGQGHPHPFPPESTSTFTLRQLLRGRTVSVGDVQLHFDEGWFIVTDLVEGVRANRLVASRDEWLSRFGLVYTP